MSEGLNELLRMLIPPRSRVVVHPDDLEVVRAKIAAHPDLDGRIELESSPYVAQNQAIVAELCHATGEPRALCLHCNPVRLEFDPNRFRASAYWNTFVDHAYKTRLPPEDL